ncbi:MAG: isocitrate lyase/PEP mutase family protein [Usitatibacter sp.]
MLGCPFPGFGEISIVTTAQKRAAFAASLKGKGSIVVAPGTGDGLGARLIELSGFRAVYVSGYAIEGTFGKPDIGLLSFAEIADRLEQIADVTTLPVIADADTGYGNAINVMRTVRSLERAGIAALQLEDQELPKKCGSMPGKVIVGIDAMVGKIKAAVDARTDPNLLVIARTDALAGQGKEAALERLARYREAGADLLMALGPYDRAGAEDILKRAPGPMVYLNAESLTMPMIAPADLQHMGVPLVIYPTSLILATARAMQRTLEAIAKTGTTENLIGGDLVPPSQFNDLVGLAEIRESESKYVL